MIRAPAAAVLAVQKPGTKGRFGSTPAVRSVVLERPDSARAGGHRCAVEGRVTDPTAAARRNHGRRYPTGVRAYILASRRRASWIEARVTKLVRLSARFSKSLASRRLRPNQEKVRSTTQRRGSTTKPFTSSLRLTISRCSGGTFATAASTCHAL